MKIDQKLLAELCRLARIAITPEEENTLKKNLTEVLSHFETIKEIPTEGVQPLVNPLEGSIKLRPDHVEDFSDKEALLKEAPELKNKLFKVPPFV